MVVEWKWRLFIRSIFRLDVPEFQQSTNIRQKAFTICLNFSSRYHLDTVVAAVVVVVAAAVVDLQVVIRLNGLNFETKWKNAAFWTKCFGRIRFIVRLEQR